MPCVKGLHNLKSITFSDGSDPVKTLTIRSHGVATLTPGHYELIEHRTSKGEPETDLQPTRGDYIPTTLEIADIKILDVITNNTNITLNDFLKRRGVIYDTWLSTVGSADNCLGVEKVFNTDLEWETDAGTEKERLPRSTATGAVNVDKVATASISVTSRAPTTEIAP